MATTSPSDGAEIKVTDLADGTDGELITWSAAAAATTVAVGTADQVLTSNGVGAAPTFQDAAGGGAWTLIGTTTFGSDDTAFRDLFTSISTSFTRLKLTGYVKGHASGTPQIRLNGETTASYRFSVVGFQDDGGIASDSSASTDRIVLFPVGNINDWQMEFDFTNVASQKNGFVGQTAVTNNSSATEETFLLNRGYLLSAAQISTISISLTDTGTTFKLFGA